MEKANAMKACYWISPNYGDCNLFISDNWKKKDRKLLNTGGGEDSILLERKDKNSYNNKIIISKNLWLLRFFYESYQRRFF